MMGPFRFRFFLSLAELLLDPDLSKEIPETSLVRISLVGK